MVDISTGERYIYATAMIYFLLLQGVAVTVVWYDINCKFGIYFTRLAQACGALRSALDALGHLAAVGRRMLGFPLPPWHKYAHRSVHSRATAMLLPHHLPSPALPALSCTQRCLPGEERWSVPARCGEAVPRAQRDAVGNAQGPGLHRPGAHNASECYECDTAVLLMSSVPPRYST